MASCSRCTNGDLKPAKAVTGNAWVFLEGTWHDHERIAELQCSEGQTNLVAKEVMRDHTATCILDSADV